jgi:O-antigen/teichoic acid export membrane protein
MIAKVIGKVGNKIAGDKDMKEITVGSSLSFIVNITGMAFGYVFVFIISKIYGGNAATIYGQYILVTMILRVGSIVTRCGMDTYMLQRTAGLASKNLWLNIQTDYRRLFLLIVGLGIIVTAVLLFFSEQFSRLVKVPQPIITLSAFFVIPMGLGIFYSQALRAIKKISISSFLRSSALPVFNFLLLPLFILFVNTASYNYQHLPSYTFFAAIIITFLIGFFSWNKNLKFYTNAAGRFDELYSKSYKELIRNSYPLLLVESMVFIGVWVDQMLLGILGTNEDVGVFNLCVKYVMLASLSLQAVNTISAPKFSEYFFQKDYKNLAINFRNTSKIIFWTALPIITAYIVFPHFFLNLFNSSFSTGSLALILLSIGAFINVMTGSVGTLLQMTGHQKIVQNVLLISVVLEAALNIILIPGGGVTGAAAASLVGSAIKNFGMSFYVKKHFGFSSIYFFGLTKSA